MEELIIKFLFIFLLSSITVKATILPEGKSEKMSEEFIKTKEKPFAYRPIDNIFWEELIDFESQGLYRKMAHHATNQILKFGEESEEGSEALLALARAVQHLGLYNVSYHICEPLAVEKNGTYIGAHALQLMSEGDKRERIDRVRLEGLINESEFVGLHQDIQSYVSFYKYFYNLKFNYNKWVQQNLEMIKEGTYWRYRIIYIEALAQVSRGQIDKGKKILNSLVALEDVPSEIKVRSNIQLARLNFEEGNLEDAFNLYTNLQDLSNREKGRLELERAWTQYYLRNYSKALGILTALKTPFYAKSLTPERYILEMLMYKELCHYKAVEKAAQEFKEVFGDTLERIRRRKPLRNDPVLFSMSILEKPLEVQANAAHFLKLERERLEELGLKYSGLEGLLNRMESHEKGVKLRIDSILEEKARVAANELLDIEEQVSFIEYISRLDALNILEEKKTDLYRPERISRLKFNKIYWLWTGEFWLDEIDNYQMLISSRCERESSGEREMEFE